MSKLNVDISKWMNAKFFIYAQNNKDKKYRKIVESC